MTRAGLPEATIRRVASMPSTSGMRTSISTTSGVAARPSATASRAVGGLADDLEVGLGVEDHAEAAAHERLVVGEHDARSLTTASSGRRAWTRKPPLGQRPGLERAAEHAPRARASRRSRGRRRPWTARVPPRPSSRTSSSSTPGAERTVTSARRRAGVAQRVGERLLHDPVGRQVDARGQRAPASPSRRQRHLEPGGAQRRGELAEPVEARLRVRRLALGVGPHARPSSRRSSRQRLAPGRLDRAQRGARLVGALVEDVVGGRGLHDDHRDAVGDHVVQLARDPRLLLADRPPRRLLDRDPAVARGLAERPRDDREQPSRRSRPRPAR